MENEAAVRAWIDVFLFRVAAMLPSKPGPWGTRRMVLSFEKAIQPIPAGSSAPSTLSGVIDYTAVVVEQCFGESALAYVYHYLIYVFSL